MLLNLVGDEVDPDLKELVKNWGVEMDQLYHLDGVHQIAYFDYNKYDEYKGRGIFDPGAFSGVVPSADQLVKGYINLTSLFG